MGTVEITADTCECRRYISDMSDDEITAWNNYVKKANAEILKLDGDKDAQLDFIHKTKYDMQSHEVFYYSLIESWYESQRQLIGCPVFEFEMLYPSFIGMKCDATLG